MKIIGKILPLSMIPAFLVYTLISLSIPLSAAESRITAYAPETVESLPLEEEVRPRQREQQPSTRGSNWWKWVLGMAVIGGLVASTGGGSSSGGGGDTDTGGATASW